MNAKKIIEYVFRPLQIGAVAANDELIKIDREQFDHWLMVHPEYDRRKIFGALQRHEAHTISGCAVEFI